MADHPQNSSQPEVHPLLAMLFGKKKKPAAENTAADVSAAAAPPAKPASSSASSAASAPKASPQMPAGPLVTVMTRNEFYRDGFRSLIRIAILEAIIIVGLILTLIIYINSSVSQDRYFATTADGRIMQLVPLDRPNMTSAALMSWVAQASTEVMTFGFHDYQRRFQQASRHFTKSGWESFTVAMQRARIIDSVQAMQQVVTAAPRSAPVLIQQGVLNGRYRWVLQMNLQVTYKSSAQGGSRTDNLKLNLVVERVSSLENPNGVGIAQWVAVAD